jgi:hypothetical protein
MRWADRACRTASAAAAVALAAYSFDFGPTSARFEVMLVLAGEEWSLAAGG